MIVKKIFSYFIPILVHKKKSIINKSLEVTWNNGKLVLDTENTNYSYGSLEKVLRKGLLEIGFKKVKNLDNILILGVAGGSVIKILNNEIKFEGKITGVEIDPETIALGNQYFGLDSYSNTTIVIDDAQNFIIKTKEKYNLIIIDVFQDAFMPSFLFSDSFLENIQNALAIQGTVLFNTIVNTVQQENRNKNFISLLSSKGITLKKISNVEGCNELFIIDKVYENTEFIL
jgi:spermidine synthase